MRRRTISIAGVEIRLEAERWSHIVEAHSEVAGLKENIVGKTTLIEKEIGSILPHLRRARLKQLSFDYDEGADVMYVSLEKPQNATDTVTRDDGVLLRYRGRRLVGLTILNYSARPEDYDR